MEYTVRFDSETLQQYNLYTTLTVCSLECIVAISELCATKTDQFHKLQKPTQQQLTRGHCTDINVKTAVYMHVNGDVQDSTFKTAKIIKDHITTITLLECQCAVAYDLLVTACCR